MLALYGLKQAPKAWYERLSKFLVDGGFNMCKVENILFIKRKEKDFLIIKIYSDDIIIGATSENLCEEFTYL